MKNKKILFVTYGGGHARLIKKLIKNFDEKDYKVLALTSAYTMFNQGVVLGISDVFNSLKSEDQELVNKIGRFLIRNKLTPNLDKETLLYYGIGSLDFVKKHSFSALSNFHWNRHLFLQVFAMRRFLEINSEYRIVVTTTSPRFERASILCAKELSLINIQIDDGFANRETLFTSQNIIVASNIEKNRLLTRGVNENIFSLGNPVLESYMNRNKISNNNNNRKIYFCPHKDKLYNDEGYEFFSGDNRQNHILEFSSLAKLLTNNPNYSLIVRPHPNDDIKEYEEFKSICEFDIVSPLKEDLKIALGKAALWITPASTTGLQASLFGVPTITYTFRNSDIHPVWRMTKKPFIYYDSLETLSQGLECLNIKKLNNVNINNWTFLENSNFRITNFIKSKYSEIKSLNI